MILIYRKIGGQYKNIKGISRAREEVGLVNPNPLM